MTCGEVQEGRYTFSSCQNVYGTGSTDVDKVEQADGTERAEKVAYDQVLRNSTLSAEQRRRNLSVIKIAPKRQEAIGDDQVAVMPRKRGGVLSGTRILCTVAFSKVL